MTLIDSIIRLILGSSIAEQDRKLIEGIGKQMAEGIAAGEAMEATVFHPVSGMELVRVKLPGAEKFTHVPSLMDLCEGCVCLDERFDCEFTNNAMKHPCCRDEVFAYAENKP